MLQTGSKPPHEVVSLKPVQSGSGAQCGRDETESIWIRCASADGPYDSILSVHLYLPDWSFPEVPPEVISCSAGTLGAHEVETEHIFVASPPSLSVTLRVESATIFWF